MKKKVFISYAHEDDGWCQLFRDMLRSDKAQPYEVWVDKDSIRGGDRWKDEIDRSLRDADAALLLISTHSLSSDFICDVELPWLRRRFDAGIPVLPVLLNVCRWETVGWLTKLQLRPKGAAEDLFRFADPASAEAAYQAKAIVQELSAKLQEGAAAGERAVPPEAAAASLLSRVLLAAQDDDSRARIADQLVEGIRGVTGAGGAALFNAARLFVEFHLLRADEPCAPRALLAAFARLPGDRVARALLDHLKRGAESGDYSQLSIPVSSMFFMHAREREDAWQAYFDALRDPAIGALADSEVGSLALIDVQWGFIAPQFLVAGLMSRFEDDWRPILSVYRQSLPLDGARDGGFASLQASQWNCWLVWGPSVPICRCAQWGGRYAFQYGYGDENNSLPLIDTVAEADASPLDELARAIVAQGQSAAVARLAGRLRWGPCLLRPAETPEAPGMLPDAPAGDFEDDDPDVIDDDPEAPPSRPSLKIALADAQAPLLCGDDSGRADGLLLELSALQPSPTPRAYFSAYLWLMFLVAGRELDDAGPRLLWRRSYPPWPEDPAQRTKVRAAQLWRQLLPVFVHANIADPGALALQRRALIDSALATLRGVWQARDDNFDADDVRRGIAFHLVCASDYSGCGDAVRFPARESLTALLAARLQREPDRAFAEAVLLPVSGETAQTRPWGLAAYFSSCHLSEMVADYFDHVARLNEDKRRR